MTPFWYPDWRAGRRWRILCRRRDAPAFIRDVNAIRPQNQAITRLYIATFSATFTRPEYKGGLRPSGGFGFRPALLCRNAFAEAEVRFNSYGRIWPC